MSERTEGWGSVTQSRKAHYFNANGRSLCGGWLALGGPRWESNQELGTKADKGACLACWRKVAAKGETP